MSRPQVLRLVALLILLVVPTILYSQRLVGHPAKPPATPTPLREIDDGTGGGGGPPPPPPPPDHTETYVLHTDASGPLLPAGDQRIVVGFSNAGVVQTLDVVDGDGTTVLHMTEADMAALEAYSPTLPPTDFDGAVQVVPQQPAGAASPFGMPRGTERRRATVAAGGAFVDSLYTDGINAFVATGRFYRP